ncbi:MAG: pca operon transcription factor PcaQ [Desulfobulbia bacterium]
MTQDEIRFMKFHQRIKFRHLQCFLEVARQGSVGKAAVSLAISQPAVSKSIRELEEILEVKLFDRSNRKISLTRFGDVFLRYASTSVTAIKQGVDTIAYARTEEAIKIRIGALPTSAARIMPLAVKRYKDSGMTAVVEVITGANEVLLSQLRMGDLDLVVGRLAEPELLQDLTFEYLYTESISIVVRADHPLIMQNQQFKLSQLAEHTVIYPNSSSIIRPYVDRFFISNGIGKFKNRIETVSMAFGRSYTLTTNAVWIISYGVVAQDLKDSLLVGLPIDTSEIVGSSGLTTRTDIPPSLATQKLMQAIRESVPSI